MHSAAQAASCVSCAIRVRNGCQYHLFLATQARACYSAPVSPAGSWDRKPVGGVWDLDDDLDLDSELGCYEDPSYFQHMSPSGTPRKAMTLPAPRFHVSPGEPTSLLLDVRMPAQDMERRLSAHCLTQKIIVTSVTFGVTLVALLERSHEGLSFCTAEVHQHQHTQLAPHRHPDVELLSHGTALPSAAAPHHQNDPLGRPSPAVSGYGGAFAVPEPVMNGVTGVLPGGVAAQKPDACVLLLPCTVVEEHLNRAHAGICCSGKTMHHCLLLCVLTLYSDLATYSEDHGSLRAQYLRQRCVT